MKYAFVSVAFGLGANALVARDAAQQCVKLQSSGGASGVLGQLDDGQNRIGGGHGEACYCLSNGAFIDSNGRGCILTPPTTQFQCDQGAAPTSGFAISNGGVTYNGSGKFYACPVNDNGEYNVYTKPAPGQKKCVEISLSSAGSCGSGPAPQPSKPAQQPPKPVESKPAPQPNTPAQQPPRPIENKPAPPPSQPAPKPSNPGYVSASCPADLKGNYEYPHLIVPVDSSKPDSAAGTSYNGKVDSHTCSIFNFDIPQSYAGKKCSVVFLFPEQKDLETSSFTVSGNGKVGVSKLKGNANQHTSWSNAPAKESDLGSYTLVPGTTSLIASGDCAAGQTVTYEMCGSGDYSLDYFQDYNPSPIGLYVRQC